MKLLGWLTRERMVGERRAPSALDWLVAFALMVIALLELQSGVFPGPVGVAAVAQLAATVPVAFRRVAPLAAIAISSAVFLPYVIVYRGAFVAGASVANAATMLLLVYSVGRHTQGRRLLVGALFALLFAAEPGIAGQPGWSDWALNFIIAGGTLGLGVALRIQEGRSISLAVAADRAQSEQEATAQAAVHEERARIARELHDVVAHNVGLIVLQAGGARSVLGTNPERARTALRQVEETSRQTLTEMRHLVGILRVDAEREPLPRLERLPALVDEARAAGLAVELEVEGAPVDLPAGLELAAYRLIQEALTNVRKHAPTSRAKVRLCYEPDRLRIEVSDDGGPSDAVRDSARNASGLGHGLIGMRERVQMYDGRMQAGPMPGGGFRVEAVLPLSVAAS